MKKLDNNEMENLIILINRAIAFDQLIIPSTIENNEIKCINPQYAVLLQPYIQIIEKGFLYQCLIDQAWKGEGSIGGEMLSVLYGSCENWNIRKQ